MRQFLSAPQCAIVQQSLSLPRSLAYRIRDASCGKVMPRERVGQGSMAPVMGCGVVSAARPRHAARARGGASPRNHSRRHDGESASAPAVVPMAGIRFSPAARPTPGLRRKPSWASRLRRHPHHAAGHPGPCAPICALIDLPCFVHKSNFPPTSIVSTSTGHMPITLRDGLWCYCVR